MVTSVILHDQLNPDTAPTSLSTTLGVTSQTAVNKQWHYIGVRMCTCVCIYMCLFIYIYTFIYLYLYIKSVCVCNSMTVINEGTESTVH